MRPSRLPGDRSGAQIAPSAPEDAASGPKRTADGYIESQPLTAKQINYAMELIEKSHKLRDIHIKKVWPCLKFCCCCCFRKKKRNFRQSLKKSLRLKLSIPNQKSDLLLEKEPYL